MTLVVRSLASGSSGNALLVRTDQTALLLDAGIGPRTLERSLAAEGVALADLTAIAITHEHTDHVRALPRLLQRETATFATAGTARSLDLPSRNNTIAIGDTVEIHHLSVRSIPTSHDAAEPCAYIIEHAEAKLVYLTDLGVPDPTHAAALRGASLVVVEANHDAAMLQQGPYPPHLKRRVASALGHLSNDATAALMTEAFAGLPSLPTIWLAHLSETNNRPEIAVQTVSRALRERGLMATVLALPRRKAGPRWRADLPPEPIFQPALDLFV